MSASRTFNVTRFAHLQVLPGFGAALSGNRSECEYMCFDIRWKTLGLGKSCSAVVTDDHA